MNDDDRKDKDKHDFDGDEFGNSLLDRDAKALSNKTDKPLGDSQDELAFDRDSKPEFDDKDAKPLSSKADRLATEDEPSSDHKLDSVETNNDQPSAGEDSTESQPEELPTKSKTELELERVESIESVSLSSSDSQDKALGNDNLANQIDSALAEDSSDKVDSSSKDKQASGASLKAGDLPVSHPEDNKKKVSLEDIIKNQKTEKQAGKKPIVWIILTVILLLAAIGAGVMYFLAANQHTQAQAKLQSELDAEKLASAKLQKDLQAAKSNQDEQDKQASETASFNTISEWAVKYPVDQTTADLTYSYSLYTVGQTEVERLAFSTTEISAIKEGTGQSVAYPCDSTKAPVGWIERLSVQDYEDVKKSVAGTPMADAYNEMNLVKLGDYYYKTGTPQNVCSEQLTSTNYADKLKAVESLPKKFVISQ